MRWRVSDDGRKFSVGYSVRTATWIAPLCFTAVTEAEPRWLVLTIDEQGVVTNWNFELGSPLFLRRLGWRSDSLKIGDQVTVEGYLAKDGAKMANARTVSLADGRKVFAGSSADGNPVK